VSRSLDDFAPSFRAAYKRWPHAPNLQQHYQDLVCTYEEGGSSLVELTKSFLETVCWTVIEELDAAKPKSSNPNTHQILRSALDALGLSNARGTGPLDDLISGLNKLTKSIDDLRRYDGSVAHGKDAFADAISPDIIRAYIAAVDAIITTILHAYDGLTPDIRTTREPVTRWTHLNDLINTTTILDVQINEEANEITVRIYNKALEEPIEMLLTPAELLYEFYREAYVNVVQAMQSLSVSLGDIEPVEQGVTEESEAATKQQEMSLLEPDSGLTEIRSLNKYQGLYQDKVTPLYEFVVHNLLDGNDAQAEQVLQFVNGLLAAMEQLAVVDWAKRPSERAKVRRAIKRLLSIQAIEGFEKEHGEAIVQWLAAAIPGEA